jgi:hypothetical protein
MKKIVDQFIVFRLQCNGLERRGQCYNHLATFQKTTHINVDSDNFLTARLTTTLLLSFNIIVKTWPSKEGVSQPEERLHSLIPRRINLTIKIVVIFFTLGKVKDTQFENHCC